LGFTTDGQLDVTFDGDGYATGNGMTDFAFGAVRIDADRTVVVGNGNMGTSMDDFVLAMFDANGAADPSFNTTGYVRQDLGISVDDIATSVTLLGNSIVVCGTRGYDRADSQFVIERRNFDGFFTSNWGDLGIGAVIADFATNVRDTCEDVAVLNDGVVATGRTSAQLLAASYDTAGV